MARGWESKSIEAQQEDLAERRSAKEDAARPVPRDAAAAVDPKLAAARRTLQLSLARAEADLAASTSPAHRAMLEQAIAALSGQLETL